jgi:hypothetical protein
VEPLWGQDGSDLNGCKRGSSAIWRACQREGGGEPIGATLAKLAPVNFKEPEQRVAMGYALGDRRVGRSPSVGRPNVADLCQNLSGQRRFAWF